MDGNNNVPEELANKMNEEIQKQASDLEKELVKQAEENSLDPMAAASTGHALYAVQFKRGVDMLSSRGAKRLLKALVDDKVGHKKYNLQGIEKTLLEIGNFALECRFLMEMHTYNENAEALARAADPNVELTKEEEEEIQKELNNG